MADRISYALVLTLALFSFSWGAWQLWRETDRAAAARLELSLGNRTAGPVEIEIGRRLLEAHTGDCEPEFRRASTALAFLDGEQAGFAPPTGQAARDATIAQLRCAPKDANAWLLLAFVEQKLGGTATEIERYMALSYRHGPREAWIAARRILFLCSYPGGIPPVLKSDAMKDFRGILEARRESDIVAAYRACSAPDRKSLDAVLATASSEARGAFARAIASSAATGP